MIKYVVIGDPVSHSRSPGMQNPAFERAGLGRPYGRRHVLREELRDFVTEAKKRYAGVNITVPHKEAVIPLLDSIDPLAALCRSVNTLDIRNGAVRGFSTDGYGLEYALRENFQLAPAGKTFCFAGCGGACRAAAIHLASKQAGRIFLANRTVSRAGDIAQVISENFPQCQVEFFELGDRRKMEQALMLSDALIQATSLGLKEDDPVPFDTNLLEANKKLCVFDTIYKNTPLLQKAAALGMKHAGGKAMLIHQGAASFRIWTGLEPDIEAMKQGFEITPVTDGDGEE